MTKYLSLILFLLIPNAANAQTNPCAFEWCDARLPKAGEKVIGEDNCGNYCSKHGFAVETVPPEAARPVETPALPCVAAPGLSKWRVEFAKADYIYHTDIEADVVETVGTFLVFKKGEIEVARFSSKYVLGYILVQP